MLMLMTLSMAAGPTYAVENKLPPYTVVSAIAPAEAAPTPHDEIARVLGLLPKPSVGFVDFGCGQDARWCIAAAEKWGCRATGVEIDPSRAKAARERVRSAGLGHLVTIIEGDAITTEVQADVGVAYLYDGVLTKLKLRIEKLTAFASYIHQPPVTSTKSGDSWIYVRPQPVPAASWGGGTYTGRVCNNPRCAMCNSIQAQLSQPVAAQPAASGHWEKRCTNGRCWYEWVPD